LILNVLHHQPVEVEKRAGIQLPTLPPRIMRRKLLVPRTVIDAVMRRKLPAPRTVIDAANIRLLSAANFGLFYG
jgi:hypothetical protein